MLPWCPLPIGRQRIDVPEVLYEEVVEVDERVILAQDNDQLVLPPPTITGTTGEKVSLYSLPQPLLGPLERRSALKAYNLC